MLHVLMEHSQANKLRYLYQCWVLAAAAMMVKMNNPWGIKRLFTLHVGTDHQWRRRLHRGTDGQEKS
eukprot:15364861-Ditylum_brightwellii.AAC.1